MARRAGPHWADVMRLQRVQFEWEDGPTPRQVRLSAAIAREGALVRVQVGGAEVEGRIDAIAGPVLHVRIGQKLF